MPKCMNGHAQENALRATCCVSRNAMRFCVRSNAIAWLACLNYEISSLRFVVRACSSPHFLLPQCLTISTVKDPAVSQEALWALLLVRGFTLHIFLVIVLEKFIWIYYYFRWHGGWSFWCYLWWLYLMKLYISPFFIPQLPSCAFLFLSSPFFLVPSLEFNSNYNNYQLVLFYCSTSYVFYVSSLFPLLFSSLICLCKLPISL